jgi:hypothetical protein
VDVKMAVAVALTAALALAACGSSEESAGPGTHPSPVGVPSAPPAGGVACPTGGHGALRVHGVGCSGARRVVRGFAAEGGSPGVVLTVNDFVCQERGRRLSCVRGTAGIVYTAAR